MIVQERIAPFALGGLEEAVEEKTCVDFFHANSLRLVDWVRQQKSASDGPDRQSFALLVKLLQQLLQEGSLQPPCENLLVLLNNMFCLDGPAIQQLLFNKPALETLRSLVIEFCQRYAFLECTDQLKEKDANLSKVNFELYSTVYFVAMLICQNHRRGEDMTLRKHFFTNSLVRALMELEIPLNSKPDIFKLLSIIMVFMVKRVVYANQWTLIKRACFAHLALLKDSKTVFNYMYCLRSVLLHQTVTTQELLKYKVLEFITDSLNFPVHQYHIGCALESLKLIYSKSHYAKHGYQKMNLLRHVKEQFEAHTPTVAGLVEQIGPLLAKEEAADLYRHFYSIFLSETESKKDALKICSILMQKFTMQSLLQILEDGILERLDHLMKSQPSIRAVQTTVRIIEFLLERFLKESPSWYPCLKSKLWSLDVLHSAASWGFHLKDMALSIIKRHNIF